MHHVLCSFLVKHQITQVTQPPYSPDLAPYNFWLFPKLKSPLKGKRFQTVNDIQENTTGQLMLIPTKDSTKCCEQWKRCWENCVRSQGAYFEGEWGIIALCTMFLVSCTFSNKCLYFSQHMAGYFLDRPCGMHTDHITTVWLILQCSETTGLEKAIFGRTYLTV